MSLHRVRRAAVALVFGILLPGAALATGPDFDAVAWRALGCDSADLIVPSNPAAASFVGDQANPPASYAYDGEFLYFRYRMDANPAGPGGFSQNVWTALMQVPSGNRFQYQYQLSLNGKDDTIEIWQNTTASDIDFSPLFQDSSEVLLHKVPFGSLARTVPAGTSFGGQADWFVDFAFPVSTMIAQGVVSGATELGGSLFFPATSTNPNNYNKSRLNCPFQPYTTLAIEKSVTPELVPANATTSVTYTIDVQNAASTAAGVLIADIPFPAWLSGMAVEVTSDDPAAVATVESTNPLRVKVPVLAPSKRVTVALTADATPGCATPAFVNTATAQATNALERTASATLGRYAAGGELCDGKDNDCNGLVDEGVLCDDGNPCTVDSCGGVAGCLHEPIPGCVPCDTAADCDDGNACTVATCTAGVCGSSSTPDCEPCATPSDCTDDGNACTVATCTAGVCGSSSTPDCEPCATPADCTDDGNACTVATCTAGVCGSSSTPGCEPCATPSDCTDDGNACTVATCTAGVCGSSSTPGCEPCATPADCTDDGNACTVATCTAGVCGSSSTPDCEPCATPSDCTDDGNACTVATCTAGVCGSSSTPDCEPCATPSDCTDDGNACTVATCTAGVCGSSSTPGCEPCATPSDCTDDGNACTVATCTAGVCGSSSTPDCEPCATPADCADDGNACTVATCTAGVCGSSSTPDCEPCATPADCADDGNACTVATCTAGVCGSSSTPDCEPCATPSDCTDDGNACTVATCTAGVCGSSSTPDCESCATPSDCTDDGNACTVATCTAGVCGSSSTPGCEPCATPSDCTDDGNACTVATCTAGVCGSSSTPGCEPCATPADCADDGNACTANTCDGSVCGALLIDGCQPCTTAADCADDDPCTTELCTEGRCSREPASSCLGCTADAECNDDNPCTSDRCGPDGSCELTSIAGCRPCTTAADCDDGDRCTTDLCTGGVCEARPIDFCVVEVCDDGIDNDGNGAIDCDDPTCAGNIACNDSEPEDRAEVCGDCIDNDGNGLVDYEDPACCAVTDSMTLRRMLMKMHAKPGRNRLRLRGKYVAGSPASFDPVSDGVTLQIADADGQLYCHDIPMRTRKGLKKRGVFVFRDRKGTTADGLRRVRVKIRKDGIVLVRVKGRKMDFRAPKTSEARVTLRVGNQCIETIAPLRTRERKNGTRMIFP